jgi:hypothetical protein
MGRDCTRWYEITPALDYVKIMSYLGKNLEELKRTILANLFGQDKICLQFSNNIKLLVLAR